MRNAGLDKAQAEIKIARRNISNLRYADDTTLMAPIFHSSFKGERGIVHESLQGKIDLI